MSGRNLFGSGDRPEPHVGGDILNADCAGSQGEDKRRFGLEDKRRGEEELVSGLIIKVGSNFDGNGCVACFRRARIPARAPFNCRSLRFSAAVLPRAAGRESETNAICGNQPGSDEGLAPREDTTDSGESGTSGARVSGENGCLELESLWNGKFPTGSDVCPLEFEGGSGLDEEKHEAAPDFDDDRPRAPSAFKTLPRAGGGDFLETSSTTPPPHGWFGEVFFSRE